MPHIHTAPGQHDATVSAFIIRFIDGQPKLLLHMHKRFGKLLQPGGHIELHENPWQAIAHELREETGYELSDLEVLQPAGMLTELPGEIIHPIPSTVNTHLVGSDDSPHYHTDSAYTFVAKDEPRFQPDDGESDDLRWLDLAEMATIPAGMIFEDTLQLAQHAIGVTLKEWQRLPATTFKI